MQMKNNCYLNGRITFRTVVKNEIDQLGHVNNAEYVKWIQDAATEHWFSVSSDDLKQKYVWFCSRHEIDYKKQLYENENIEIRTWLGEAQGARFDRFVDIRVAGSPKPAVLAKTTWVLMDKDRGRPIRIKSDILLAFTKL